MPFHPSASDSVYAKNKSLMQTGKESYQTRKKPSYLPFYLTVLMIAPSLSFTSSLNMVTPAEENVQLTLDEARATASQI
jgi:hypothetical protein